MTDVLALVGGVITLFGTTPAFFRHPYRQFVGLRLAVGITMLVGTAGMVVFLVRGQWHWFFLVAILAEALGWFSPGYIVGLMKEQAGKSKAQRRRQNRRLPEFSNAALIWVGALVVAVAPGLAVVQHA